MNISAPAVLPHPDAMRMLSVARAFKQIPMFQDTFIQPLALLQWQVFRGPCSFLFCPSPHSSPIPLPTAALS